MYEPHSLPSPRQASDGKGSHTAQVHVAVRDVNNNAPVFSNAPYAAAVQENAPIGEPNAPYAAAVQENAPTGET